MTIPTASFLFLPAAPTPSPSASQSSATAPTPASSRTSRQAQTPASPPAPAQAAPTSMDQPDMTHHGTNTMVLVPAGVGTSTRTSIRTSTRDQAHAQTAPFPGPVSVPSLRSLQSLQTPPQPVLYAYAHHSPTHPVQSQHDNSAHFPARSPPHTHTHSHSQHTASTPGTAAFSSQLHARRVRLHAATQALQEADLKLEAIRRRLKEYKARFEERRKMRREMRGAAGVPVMRYAFPSPAALGVEPGVHVPELEENKGLEEMEMREGEGREGQCAETLEQKAGNEINIAADGLGDGAGPRESNVEKKKVLYTPTSSSGANTPPESTASGSGGTGHELPAALIDANPTPAPLVLTAHAHEQTEAPAAGAVSPEARYAEDEDDDDTAGSGQFRTWKLFGEIWT